jgi:hypothetical protein
MTYRRWKSENQACADRSLAHCEKHGRKPEPAPDLSPEAFAADSNRQSDGRIHPWWAGTDEKYRRRAMAEILNAE